MGTIFYLMGKSASGKDSIFRSLCERKELSLHTIILYTTRPIRSGETEGKEYHFIDDATAKQLNMQGKVIEHRAYHTVHGIWKYMTVDDGSMDLEHEDYLAIGTLESYLAIRNYFGNEHVKPIYIWVEDGERLMRAVQREMTQTTPKYAEICRRFLADTQDFAEEKLQNAGVEKRFENRSFSECVEEIVAYILSKEEKE